MRKSARRAILDNFGTKELALEFFTTDAPNPSALTQNSCLARFWSFSCGTKNSAKNGSEGRSGHFWFERTCSFGSGTKNYTKIGSDGRSGHFWYERTCC